MTETKQALMDEKIEAIPFLDRTLSVLTDLENSELAKAMMMVPPEGDEMELGKGCTIV